MKKFKIIILISLIFLVGCKNSNNNNLSNNNTTEEVITELSTESEFITDVETLTQRQQPNIEGEEVVIKEKLFITQIEDIYYNFDMYKDKKIVLEGMYALFYNQEGVKNINAVYRKAPGCCGNDGWAGFFLKYDGEYPKENDWIRVVGTPEIVKNGEFSDLYLNVESIEVLDKRGEEFVVQ